MIPTILVIEDNPLNLELVRDLLIASDVQTIVPKSGAEGILRALERLGLWPEGPAASQDRLNRKVGSG
jgi:CheY-like chemotaxis protein